MSRVSVRSACDSTHCPNCGVCVLCEKIAPGLGQFTVALTTPTGVVWACQRCGDVRNVEGNVERPPDDRRLVP